MKRLYVGNLPPGTTAAEVRAIFTRFGDVASVTLGTDRFSGRAKDFGYVEMEEGDAAIAGLNRTELRGNTLTVCGARPKTAVGAETETMSSRARMK